MIQPNPCDICHSNDIDVKIIHITENKVKVFAYCRKCKHKGLYAIGTFDQEEAKEAAYRMWNSFK